MSSLIAPAGNIYNGELPAPRFYDPETKDHATHEAELLDLYQEVYPWHGTDDASAYYYPSFIEAVKGWSQMDSFIATLTAKIYLETLYWLG